jgi:hypothetical protein
MTKPRVFIGSSKKGVKIAEAIQAQLEEVADVWVWDQKVFRHGYSHLENLLKILDSTDFAVLVLTADDEIIDDERSLFSPRDNVLFECGLFMGRLGRDRTYVVYDRDANIKLPSDLAGVSLASYAAPDETNPVPALGPACTAIKSAIEQFNKVTKEIELFEFHQKIGEGFYKTLVDSYRHAKKCIYVSGRGFVEAKPSTKLGQHIAELIFETEEALKRGVTIFRIQTSKNVSSLWAERFAELMDKYPDRLKVFADYSDPAFVNVGIVDPEEEGSLVELMFESQKFSLDQAYYSAVTAIFLRNKRELAISLQRSFIDHSKSLRTMSPDDMRLLGGSFLYFAYGSNLSTSQMKQRCPQSAALGIGVIYNWRLSFSVKAPHLGGVAAGIYESQDDTVSGVVYRMTYEDKVNLDAIESGGYVPVTVSVKMKDQTCDAFTYVPAQQPAPSDTSLRPPSAYINQMIEGAREHGLTDLAAHLEQIRDQ